MDSDACADEDLALAFADSPSLLLSPPEPQLSPPAEVRAPNSPEPP